MPSCRCLGVVWGRLGVVFGRQGVVLGPSWAVLGPSWGRLGGVLGRSWGRLGALFGVIFYVNPPVMLDLGCSSRLEADLPLKIEEDA